MRNRTLFILSSFVMFVLLLAMGLSDAAAEASLQAFQQTATPIPAQETPDAEISTVDALPTAEIDPESLVFEDNWQNPYNLSKSGATSNSQLVIDNQGTKHVLWVDELEGFGYTVGQNDQWSIPTSAEYPFYTRRLFIDLRDTDPTPRFTPVLAADNRGNIFAFWIGDFSNIYYSTVPADSFTDYTSWTPRTAVGAKALLLTAKTGEDGAIHLAYIQPEDTEARPSGVYYQQVDPNGTFNEPVLLYASRYLRSISRDEANIQLLVTDSNNVHVAWDDTLKQQVYLASSNDNGATWNTIQEIDRRTREDEAFSAGPSNISIGKLEDQLHLTWNAGHEINRICSQYVSISLDNELTWSEPVALTSVPTCFASTQFIAADNRMLLLGTTVEEGEVANSIVTTSYLMAWNGEHWSDPQIQEPLSSFANPETNQAVSLSCHIAHNDGNDIRLIGCDTADGGDTWQISRQIGEVEEWFPPPPVWQGPIPINTSGSKPLEVHLLGTGDGIVHSFWNNENGPQIYHASWDNEGWSSGFEIIKTPGNNVDSLHAASASDKIYLVWKDRNFGIQFSEASLSNSLQWASPVSLIEEKPFANSPSIIADEGGNIFIAYSESFNEERGVYLIHSADAGETWSAPRQVFDGADAGWDMVDKPVLTKTDNGQMHLMWTRGSLPPDSVPLGLTYSRSEDLGQTWSNPEIVIEAETYWHDLIGAGERFVHRIWSEESEGNDGIWHSYSIDGGLSWSPSGPIIRFSNRNGIATTLDPANRPHLLTMEDGRMSNLVWENENWIDSEGMDTGYANEGVLSAAVNINGELVVSYINLEGAAEGKIESSPLSSMWRSLELPSELPTPLPTIAPTQIPPTLEPTTTPEPTPTIFFSTEREETGITEIPGIGGIPFNLDILVSLLPVLLIIGVGIFIGIRIIRRR